MLSRRMPFGCPQFLYSAARAIQLHDSEKFSPGCGARMRNLAVRNDTYRK